MRSLLVAVLFAHAEAQLPEEAVVPAEEAVVPQNATSANTSAQQQQQQQRQPEESSQQQQQPEESPETREKYMREYAGQYADFGHNDTFDTDGQQTPETQAYYKNLYMNEYGGNYSQYRNQYGGDYSQYMNQYGGNYSQYMNQYGGGGSSGGYMNQYGSGGSSGGYGDYQQYVDQFVPAAYRDEAEQATSEGEPEAVGTTVNSFHAILEMVTTTTGFMEPFIKDALAAPAEMGLGGGGPSPGSEEAAALASPTGRGSSAWLVLCAFAGASIPVAYAAARRGQRLESDEEPTRFLLMA